MELLLYGGVTLQANKLFKNKPKIEPYHELTRVSYLKTTNKGIKMKLALVFQHTKHIHFTFFWPETLLNLIKRYVSYCIRKHKICYL